ncbi:probable disease resistance protein At4g27220 isoform X2 [Syzygium oleosum]|nr:probable disease resistance protein At4g27220 isoform X2 [Syzygium oleosum]XP_056167321.1 probable disease resistance protein At4g27220 isoform X2 [Syzygium oleosum]
MYDVFLSFRGEDTRRNFTDHLYHALKDAGVNTFRDNDALPRGKVISSELGKAIQGSRISVIVFSRNYAHSRWCLEELVKIMECRQDLGQLVLPVFYDIDPSDVRKQTGSFAEAFANLEERFKGEKDKVVQWKAALTQVGNLSGWVLRNVADGHEGEFIRKIVDDVLKGSVLNTNADGKMDSLRRKLERLSGRESDVLTEVGYAESRLGNRRKREVENWLRNVQRVKDDILGIDPQVADRGVRPQVSLVNQINRLTTEVEELIEQGEFSRGLTHVEEDTRTYELLTVELVGEAFRRNQDRVLSRLMEDDVLTVGIYGMGGVGKTTLVTHVHNHLLKASPLRKVCWVTVSQECDVPTLQQRIWECFKHDLIKKEDKIKQAAELSHLLKRESTIIILDDLWHAYDLQEVGIPLGVNGCKLILTTRSLDICRQMNCDELVELKSLPENEAWQLFVKNLGRGVVFAPEVESVAKSVAKECAGLPLGIVVVSGSMRGKEEDIHEWRSALNELKEARFEGKGMEDKVFRVLKFSFIRLNDQVVQQCFLHLALYPEDFVIQIKDLLRNLDYLDFFSDLKSREAQYDRGHTIVNKLVNVCLLEKSGLPSYERLKMHDLVRDMAINMMGSQCMVKAGLGLCTIPAQEEWFKDLEKVSLIKNSLIEIPAVRRRSWDLPQLLELYMSYNILKRIDGSFFCCMPALQVLDLSMTSIEMLPSSISNLVNLTHLLLRRCKCLWRVPSLAKLRALRTLDFSGSAIEKVPAGLHKLVNLRCLDFGKSNLEKLPPGILPKLSNMQTLNLKSQCNSLRVQAQEIMSLSKLEKLSCKFGDVQNYDLYVKHLQAGGPKEWEIELIEGPWDDNYFVGDVPTRTVRLLGCHVGGDGPKTPRLLPKDVQLLEITGAVDEPKSLTDIPIITNSKLTMLTLSGIRGMKYVVSQSSSSPLPSLESLELGGMTDLRALAEEEPCAVAPAVPGVLYEGDKFWGLKELTIFECQKMKRLLTHVLLPLLSNLEELFINGCDQMEEVIAMTEVDMGCKEEGDTRGSYTRSEANHVHLASALSLPKLKTLKLGSLPALKSICGATISCHSLQKIYLRGCPKLECISLLVQLPRDGEPPSGCLQRIWLPSGEEEWWKSVVWNDSLSKSFLDPYVKYW